MDLKEKIIDVNRIYEGKKINVDVLKVKMPNNKEAIREIVDRKNGVVILAIDDENNVIVEEQYRNTFKRGIVGLPAGKRDGAEDLLDTAKRELEEETSLIAKDLKLICVSDDMTDTAHYVTAGFLVNCYEGEIKAMEPETILEWKWFDIDNLPENMYKPSKVVIEKYLNNIIYE